MKRLMLLCALLVVGCAEFKTLEELELAALQSGDWSAVEQRERLIAKRQARSSNKCRTGSILVCENHAGHERCSCRSSENVRAFLESL